MPNQTRPTPGMDSDMDSDDVNSEMDSDRDGYCIKFYVWPDGTFSIGEPQPISDEEADANVESEGENQSDLTSALKRLLNVVKSNPVSGDDEEQFAAGYAAGPGGTIDAGAS